jgi:micrococcal nuclease
LKGLWDSFWGLSTLLKVVLIAALFFALIVAVSFLTLLSPLMVVLTVLAFAVCGGIFLFKLLSSRRLARNWGLATAASFILIFVFTGVSGAIYGGGEPTEVAEREKPFEQTTPEETTSEPTIEETTELAGADESEEEDEDQDRDRGRIGERERVATPPPPPEPDPEPESRYDATVTITSVTDGDTVEISPAVNGYTDVRLIGVDTPETYGGEEPYGSKSSAFTTERLTGQTVDLELDVEEVDDFDRLLAYVWVGDELFNETLVREGYAQVATFPPNVKYVDRFLAAQEEARAAKLGLWGLSVPEQCQLVDRGNGIGEGSAACLMPEDPVAPAPGIDEPPVRESAPAPEIESAPVPEIDPAPVLEPEPTLAPAPVPSGGDIDCDQVAGPIPTPPGDPDGLDGDGDGLACE